MDPVTASLAAIQARITQAEKTYSRPPGSVTLLAVSKTQPADAVRSACDGGQRAFGENHLQDALTKITAIRDIPLEWHFIGPVQSNKTRQIAENFSWVHSLDRLRVASRLNDQRPPSLPPLNVCIQVNVSDESSKSGVQPKEVEELAARIAELDRLALRGLMAIPAPTEGFEAQRASLRPLKALFDSLCAAGFPLDTLSMGMTDDLEAAVAEGSTMVRIGTAIFGARRQVVR